MRYFFALNSFLLTSLISAQSSFVSSSFFATSSIRPSSSQGPTSRIQSTSTRNQNVATTTPNSNAPSPTSNPTPSSLPICAPQCLILKQAQVRCMQGNPSAQINQTTYQQCFCKSSAYISLQHYDTFCSTECPSQSDRSAIKAFYHDFCSTSTSSTATSLSATDTPSTATGSATKPSSKPLSKATTIGIGVGASIGLILLCCLAYYPVFRAGRRAKQSETSSLAGSHHRRKSSSKTQNTNWTTDEEEGGAPIAEIARSPMRRSRRSSFGRSSIEGIPASPKIPPDTYQVISVAAFKE
ncbi:hypothetical protein EG328_009369 [Venturia inaequalis]|uniref:Extracellular membrane protein CFEM domain-containing protein n=1 Tax=Venturia inaequalis TaxID=5025 RepID=A0A8H3Z303_VENIN|nr:hypothetical protein EG328_009369 [Venturia inaequalis]KAE9991601.1 hypothetical protein EG327_011369 [Venturia inaequalis]